MKTKQFIRLLCLSLLFFVLLRVFFSLNQNREIDSTPEVSCGCSANDLSGKIDFSNTVAIFEGKDISVSDVALSNSEPTVLGLANEERWIEIDLSDQKLFAWEGGNLFLETPVSTGLPWWPTPTGEFRIWIKLRAAKMEGGQGRLYYYLPNVPYVMYFSNSEIPSWRGYGLHGTYWHNDFGNPHSHGCVNLPTEMAKELYYWVGPVLSDGKTMVESDGSNLGTRIVIHE